MFQVTITPAAGKRLIAKAITQHADVKKVLSSGTVVIIAGTTNGYVAEEIITELEAISLLSGANAALIAGGGVCGAEGSVWLAIDGQPDELKSIKGIIDSTQNEPAFTLQ